MGAVGADHGVAIGPEAPRGVRAVSATPVRGPFRTWPGRREASQDGQREPPARHHIDAVQRGRRRGRWPDVAGPLAISLSCRAENRRLRAVSAPCRSRRPVSRTGPGPVSGSASGAAGLRPAEDAPAPAGLGPCLIPGQPRHHRAESRASRERGTQRLRLRRTVWLSGSAGTPIPSGHRRGRNGVASHGPCSRPPEGRPG